MNRLIGLLFIVVAGIFTSSCDPDTLEALTCEGCDSAFPYSNTDANQCYDTKSACEDAEGKTCVLCI